jgi:hypothetical protein
LAKDIANTSTAFATVQGSAPIVAAATSASATAAAPGPAAPGPAAPAPKPSSILSYEITVNKVPYIAVAKLKKGQLQPLTFDLYARGDINRLKKLGTSIASSSGLPTKNIVFE